MSSSKEKGVLSEEPLRPLTLEDLESTLARMRVDILQAVDTRIAEQLSGSRRESVVHSEEEEVQDRPSLERASHQGHGTRSLGGVEDFENPFSPHHNAEGVHEPRPRVQPNPAEQQAEFPILEGMMRHPYRRTTNQPILQPRRGPIEQPPPYAPPERQAPRRHHQAPQQFGQPVYEPRPQNLGVKLTIPHYEGTSNVESYLDWVATIESVFYFYQYNDAQRVALATIRGVCLSLVGERQGRSTLSQLPSHFYLG